MWIDQIEKKSEKKRSKEQNKKKKEKERENVWNTIIIHSVFSLLLQ
jgi:hypothetical protein